MIKSLNSTLNEQTLRAPALLWMIKFRGLAKFEKLLDELMTPVFLLRYFPQSIMNPSKCDQSPDSMAEILSDDKELLRDILTKGTAENAKDLAQPSF